MVNVVRLSENDLGRMRALNALFASEFGDPQSYTENSPDDAYLADRLSNPGVIALVAEEAGDITGGLVAYELPKLEQKRSEIYIYDLAVAVAHRRKGIATALIARVRDIAKECRAWVVYVQADYGDEPAIALYTKLGIREDVMHFDIDVQGGEKA
jgi:aminoglycoside 3-N-acetyltransferase I